MARMYPQKLPDSVASSAERNLFEAFAEQLDDQFTVFAGVSWMRLDDRGRARPAEADFVIAHPDRGILLIEVKGGGISYDARTASWHSRDRYGSTHPIKDPLGQAKGNYYDLVGKLGTTPVSSGFRFSGGHGVAFPDVQSLPGTLPLHLPREILIDLADTRSLRKKLMSMFQYWCSERTSGPGHAGLQALTEVLAKSWEVEVPLSAILSRESKQFNKLTEDQFDLLDFLGRRTRVLVNGCAGSGKTFLALEKARRLADDGIRTLFTCYNKALAHYIRKSLEPLPDNLHVQHFHELAYDLAGKAGLDNTVPAGNEDAFFNTILPERLLEAVDVLGPQFQAIIVDEGQDFRDDWWIPLQSLMQSPDSGILYVFYDTKQCLYTDEIHPPFEAEPFPLLVNLRNTRAIHQQIAPFYDASVRCKGPEGRPPTIISTVAPERELQKQINRLTRQELLHPNDITVLTAASQRRSRWNEGMRFGNLSLTWLPDMNEREIRVSTIHSFKGLESPVIILTEFDPKEDNELALVAYSRAKSELIVVQEALQTS